MNEDLKKKIISRTFFTAGDNYRTTQGLQALAFETGRTLVTDHVQASFEALAILKEKFGLIPFFQDGVLAEVGGTGVESIRLTTENLETMVTAYFDCDDSDPKYHRVGLTIGSLDLEIIKSFFEVAKANPPKYRPNPKPLGTIHVCVENPGNGKLMFHEITTIGERLIRENYSSAVIGQYDNLTKQLLAPNPSGRLALMAGPPGTGKTRAVRGLINDAKKAFWVLIPSNMVRKLSSPDFLVLLLGYSNVKRPMVLVIEDADEALRKRGTGTDTELSALLNFSDGIFGSMLDTRVVCTTNISLAEIDPAVIRPGRLIEKIEIGCLSAAEATAAYTRISGGKERIFAQPTTIAQVYAQVTLDKETSIAA